MRRTRTGQQLIEQISELVVLPGAIGIWWLGQASLVLKVEDQVIFVDPYLSDSPRRMMPSPISAELVTNADLVLLTHGHGDHLDAEALPVLAAASPRAPIVAPAPIVERVKTVIADGERIVAASVDERLTFSGIEIIPVPAKHEEFDEDPGLGFPYLGYVLIANGLTIYLAGDTIPYDGLIETLLPFHVDLAFLPINGRDYFRTRQGVLGNMDGREAAELSAALDIDTVVPVHYGMFANNTVPPGDFVTYLAANHPHVHAHILGQSRLFVYQRGDSSGGMGCAS